MLAAIGEATDELTKKIEDLAKRLDDLTNRVLENEKAIASLKDGGAGTASMSTVGVALGSVSTAGVIGLAIMTFILKRKRI